MSNYTEKIRQWAADTRRAGEIPDADGVGEVGLGAEEAGTRLAVRFALRIREGRIAEARYQVFGCGFSLAACAAAADLAEARTLEEAGTITPARIDAELGGLPSERGYCADLAAEALQGALASALGESHAVRATVPSPDDHGPRLGPEDPVYRALVESPAPPDVSEEDRHLFACLLAIAAGEPWGTAAALGLAPGDLEELMACYFPAIDPAAALRTAAPGSPAPPEIHPEVQDILLSHAQGLAATSHWLARILAARAAHPGHLWVAMGLFERLELTGAIRRHLPSLAEANDQGMRWKRFLFKQVCDLHGAVLCKAPDCGVCSDYALCFPADPM